MVSADEEKPREIDIDEEKQTAPVPPPATDEDYSVFGANEKKLIVFAAFV
jgi:hypothetical protein